MRKAELAHQLVCRQCFVAKSLDESLYLGADLEDDWVGHWVADRVVCAVVHIVQRDRERMFYRGLLGRPDGHLGRGFDG